MSVIHVHAECINNLRKLQMRKYEGGVAESVDSKDFRRDVGRELM